MSANNTPMSVTAEQFMQFDFCALCYFRHLQEIQRLPALRFSLAVENLRDVAVPDQRNHRAQRGGRQNMLSFEGQRAMAQARQKKTVVGFSDPSVLRRSDSRALCAAILCLGAMGGGNPCRYRKAGSLTCCCPGTRLAAIAQVHLTLRRAA